MTEIDLIVRTTGELLTLNGPPGPRTGDAMSQLSIIDGGAVAIDGGKVVASGPADALCAAHTARQTIDAGDRLVMPGFVDPHTHPVFATTREDEFAMRLAGRSYMDIAEAGGGIHASVRKLRDLDEQTLLARTLSRLRGFLPLGTTTVECKSGYGLTTEDELKSLRVIAAAAGELDVDLVPTFLGAHEIPVDRRADREGYIREVIETMLPAVAEEGLALFCDVFCEHGVFTPQESTRILEAGTRHGLRPKIHADELVPSGGAEVAAAVGAISADHLVKVGDAQIEALAGAGVIAVLLPGTTFHLGKTAFAPARQMIAGGVPVAVATDYNPGTSMTRSMQMILSLAMIGLRLTAAEAITAATHNAACAIGLDDEVGRLAPGHKADVVIHDVANHQVLPYHYGESHVWSVIKDGRVVVPPPR